MFVNLFLKRGRRWVSLFLFKGSANTHHSNKSSILVIHVGGHTSGEQTLNYSVPVPCRWGAGWGRATQTTNELACNNVTKNRTWLGAKVAQVRTRPCDCQQPTNRLFNPTTHHLWNRVNRRYIVYCTTQLPQKNLVYTTVLKKKVLFVHTQNVSVELRVSSGWRALDQLMEDLLPSPVTSFRAR